MGSTAGTGIGRNSAGIEVAMNAAIQEEYRGRLKAGFPCGTHTLYRKTPKDVTPNAAR